jgi:hypothetical protein
VVFRIRPEQLDARFTRRLLRSRKSTTRPFAAFAVRTCHRLVIAPALPVNANREVSEDGLVDHRSNAHVMIPVFCKPGAATQPMPVVRRLGQGAGCREVTFRCELEVGATPAPVRPMNRL